jgi:hypothetical protein
VTKMMIWKMGFLIWRPRLCPRDDPSCVDLLPPFPALENAAYLVHDASRRRCLERGHVILHGIRGHRFILCGFPGHHAGLSSLFKLLPSPPLAPAGLRGGMREGGVP